MAHQLSDTPRRTSLNKSQTCAVTSKANTVAILAGPGSGKTHTLTSRVSWLIQEAGYQPSDVIVATFTVKAAREMKERIIKSLGEECGQKIVLGTFHSISRRYLARYGSRIGLESKFGIADDGDSRAIIQRICKRLKLPIDPSAARAWISKRKAKGNVDQGTVKGKTQKQAQDSAALLECFQEYQEQLSRSKLLDYDDLLVKGVELLRSHPECVSNVQAVLIDEYQDTNGVQYDLMRLFAQARNRITVVGDPDQSIYGWRSAEVRNLYRLLKDYPGTHEISLEENYRSSQSILNIAQDVIQQDQGRYQKVLMPVHHKGTKPVLRKLKNAATEGDWIVSEIQRIVMMFGGTMKHEDVAILLRSASLSRHVEASLGKAGISYQLIGGHKFYERREIKLLLDYLRVVNHPHNNDALARIINVPRRGIGEATIKSLLEEAEIAGLSVWSVIVKHCRGIRTSSANLRPKMEAKLNTELIRTIESMQSAAGQDSQGDPSFLVTLIEKLIKELDFKKYLEAEFPEYHEQRWSNVQEFVALAGDFSTQVLDTKDDDLPDIENLEQNKHEDVLGQFLANVALAADAQTGDKSEDEQDKKSLVTISTIHAAKGLEWPVVFIPSTYEGSIPHSRSDDHDEERRLLYVAMTRAQALLYLSCPVYGSQGMGSKVELSSFITPISPRAFLQQGPSFDKHVMEGVAKVLGRRAPSDSRVFEKLPAMFFPEDNLFPLEPFGGRGATDGLVSVSDSYPRGQKRPRMTCNEEREKKKQGAGWERGYHTTMETASNFTMSTAPTFTTAGQHHAAAKAAQASEPKRLALSRPGTHRGSGKVSADQSRLTTHGFMRQGSAGIEVCKPISRDNRHEQRTWGQDRATAATGVAEPAIPASLAGHQLRVGATRHHATMPSHQKDLTPRERYANFSSSPPRPGSSGGRATSDQKKEAEDENDIVLERDRPTTSYHSTTFTAVKGPGGLRKPVRLGPAPFMDRLRQPFKPLTMNRPRGTG